MNDLFNSLKSDLLDRRFLPILALVGVALVAAFAYAVLGGGSSTSPTTPTPSASSGATKAVGVVAISQAPAPDEAVSETTNSDHQHSGAPRNPFTPLPSTKAKSSTAPASTSSTPASSSPSGGSSSSSPAGSSSSGSSGGSGSSSPSTPAKPAKPKAPTKIYQVDVLFGAAPVGTPSQSIPLTVFNNLTRLSPLSVNGQAPLLVFAGATAGGASAIFTIVSEVFPHGPAVCHPSASQCQAIQLAPGQSEELEYAPLGGQALVYRLELGSITAVKASAARAASAFRATSPAGRALLRAVGLSALPGLRYSTDTGVIVLRAHRSFRAHAASRHR
jgi:cytoskeletal protein RodZ